MMIGQSVRVAVAARPGDATPEQDAWVARRTGEGELALAVVDGAGIRVTLGDGEPTDSRELADLIAASLAAEPKSSARGTPSGMLEVANRAARHRLLDHPSYQAIWPLLRSRPEPLVGALRRLAPALAARVADAFGAALGSLDGLDTRYLRLALPACVVTVARLNLNSGRVEFAHVGDTALLRVRGHSISRVTHDQMGRFDDQALDVARGLVAHTKANSIVAAASFPEVRRSDVLNGVRHNYVREDGSIAIDEGCGVINGQEEMAAFIQSGSFTLDRGEAIALLSDGMTIPLHTPEVEGAMLQDLVAAWRGALGQIDSNRLVASLDAILDLDPDAAMFPRLKDRDDATAVMALLSEVRA